VNIGKIMLVNIQDMDMQVGGNKEVIR